MPRKKKNTTLQLSEEKKELAEKNIQDDYKNDDYKSIEDKKIVMPPESPSKKNENSALISKLDKKINKQPLIINFGDWQAMAESVVGLAHRKKNLPCQDFSIAVVKPRPVFVVADGAGSAAVSELGSEAIGRGLLRLANTLNHHLAPILDVPEPNSEMVRHWSLTFIKHSMGLLEDISSSYRRESDDFRSTCLLAIIGKVSALWVKVGDGFIIAQNFSINEKNIEKKFTALGGVQKGEFANQTTFISRSLNLSEVQYGVISAETLCGLVAMSDGAAERLVSNDGSFFAGRIDSLLEKLNKNSLERDELTKMFYSEDFCNKTTGDDRSISLLSRSISIT